MGHLVILARPSLVEEHKKGIFPKFFPHAIIMEDSLLIGPSDDDIGNVNTLLNLLNH